MIDAMNIIPARLTALICWRHPSVGVAARATEPWWRTAGIMPHQMPDGRKLPWQGAMNVWLAGPRRYNNRVRNARRFNDMAETPMLARSWIPQLMLDRCWQCFCSRLMGLDSVMGLACVLEPGNPAKSDQGPDAAPFRQPAGPAHHQHVHQSQLSPNLSSSGLAMRQDHLGKHAGKHCRQRCREHSSP